MIDYLNDLLQVLDKIQGLSAVALICFSCIVLGYILRFIRTFPNDAIPLVVILWGIVAMLFIADPRASNMPLRIWTARNVMVGAIIGFISWMLHKLVLSRLEDYIAAKLPGSKDTQFFNRKDSDVDEKPKTETPKPNT